MTRHEYVRGITVQSTKDFWHGDDDAAVARYLAEHGSVGAWDGDAFVVSAGNEELLPPWPPEPETVPCPTCWLPADLVVPSDVDVLHHSRCPAGHDNSLAPAVLAHLRTLG